MKPCNTYLEFPDIPQYPEKVFLIRLRVIWKPQLHSLHVPVSYLGRAHAIKTWSLQEVLNKTIVIHFSIIFKDPKKTKGLIQLWKAKQPIDFRGEQSWNENGIFKLP